ncbi:hypothetical protein I5730_14600 [Acinetobacter nosocomialis]|uniref:hypothetical protein n=1 Tax=Acinetobacter nosocomialis TaxID=106654 RepID=UPI0018FF1AE7|nr:hypothetical protein [Acinetobacter nosocomialis]MBJ9961770.1 hypothetical protein [Acinetobacter nosocomialis]
MDKDWIEERHRINAILGNDKPSILESFTVLPYDFSFDLERGRLNIDYINEKLVLDIAQKYNVEFILSILNRTIQHEINNLLSDNPAYTEFTIRRIKSIIHEVFNKDLGNRHFDFMEFLNELRDELYRSHALDRKNLV